LTEIEIPDPGPENPPPPVPAEPEEPQRGANSLVPLVVVPALIGMVIVVVWGFFTTLVGEEDTPRENLDRVLNGGAKERQQAAFGLVRQVLEYREARRTGATPEWDIDESFLPVLREERARMEAGLTAADVPTAFVLSSILAELGDPEGVRQLVAMTALGDVLDPEHEYRIAAVRILGGLGPELEPTEHELAAETLIGLLSDPDPGLVLIAIAGLQNLPSPRAMEALRERLSSGSLAQRTTAALSLAMHDDASGADVLREALGRAPYATEREADPRKWPPQFESDSRRKALAALVRLGLGPSVAELETIAGSDEDPQMRVAARALLEGAAD
jgi:hypothetical protein